MERMVTRSPQDSTLVTTEAVESHVVFRKDYYNIYLLNYPSDKVNYYVYSLIEVLCFQCKFLIWDDFRK